MYWVYSNYMICGAQDLARYCSIFEDVHGEIMAPSGIHIEMCKSPFGELQRKGFKKGPVHTQLMGPEIIATLSMRLKAPKNDNNTSAGPAPGVKTWSNFMDRLMGDQIHRCRVRSDVIHTYVRPPTALKNVDELIAAAKVSYWVDRILPAKNGIFLTNFSAANNVWVGLNDGDKCPPLIFDLDDGFSSLSGADDENENIAHLNTKFEQWRANNFAGSISFLNE